MGENINKYTTLNLKVTFDALTLGEQDTFIQTLEVSLEELKQRFAENKESSVRFEDRLNELYPNGYTVHLDEPKG